MSEYFKHQRQDNGGDNSPPPISIGNNNSNNTNDTKEDTTIDPDKPGTNSDAYHDRSDLSVNKNGNVSNPRMSYYKPDLKYMQPSEIRDTVESFTRLNNGSEDIPPSFYEGYYHSVSSKVAKSAKLITYTSENKITNNNGFDIEKHTGSCYFRLGSFESIIPPEFIQVYATSNNESIQTMRSASPMYKKSAYHQNTITVKLFLSNIESINGQEVDSPFGYKHYINGLRHLIGMYKYTPFVPVVNDLLNECYGITNVALVSIQSNTVEGFPNTLEVILTLKEFNIEPYIDCGSVFFDQMIMWDLFNFYIQRNIRDKDIGLGIIQNGRFNENFSLYLLNELVLDETNGNSIDDIKDDSELKIYCDKNGNVDLLDNRNYIKMFDIKDKTASITNISIASANNMPSIQMSGHSNPTFQFLGGNTIEFEINIETKSQPVVNQLVTSFKASSDMVKKFPYKTGVGFIKIDNEILSLYGVKHTIINNVVSNTVPGFPGLYQVTITGVGYDASQKDREKFKSFRPFYNNKDEKNGKWFEGRHGTKEDMIVQNPRGLANKVLQDSAAEAKLMTTELYPDLRLPKYSAVDWALGEIIKFNKKHNLSIDGIPTKLTRPKSIVPGRGPNEVEYNGFVDPDFYVSYFIRASHFDPSGSSPRSSENKKENDARFNKYILKTRQTIDKKINNIEINNDNFDIDKLRRVIGDDDIDIVSASYMDNLKPHYIEEPKYVPGYEPNMQIRTHHTILEDGKSDDEELIDKLNSWLKIERSSVSAGSSSSVGGDFSHALTGQPGDNTQLPKQVKKVTGNPFVDMLINRASVQCGYMYGATEKGEICTEKRIQQVKAAYSSYVNVNATRKWIGRQVWDCSSFVSFGLQLIGIDIPRIGSSSFGPHAYPNIFETIDRSEAQAGDIFYNGGHVSVYCGDGVVVHARGAEYGCVMNKHNYTVGSSTKCGKTSRVKNMQKYIDAFLKAHPDFYINDTSSNNNSSSSNNNITLGQSNTTNTNNSTISTRSQFELINKLSKSIKATNSENNINISLRATTNNISTSSPTLGTFPSSPIKVGKYSYNGSAVNKWDQLIIKYSTKYNIDPNFIKALVLIESSGNEKLYNKICCYGLLQVHAKAHNVSGTDMLNPEKNLDKGCSILSEYGNYNYIKYDKKWWLASYNAGPGVVRQVQAGRRNLPTETQNYIKKFDAFYAVLLANGGNPGSSKRPLQDGEAFNPEWSNNVSSSENASSTTSTGSFITNVWFENTDGNSTGLNVDKLINLAAGFVHKTAKIAMNMVTFGLSASGSSSQANNTSRISQRLNINYDESISSKLRVANIYQDVPPTQKDFGVAMIDNLSDKEFNFNVSKIAKIEDFKNNKHTSERMFVDSNIYSVRGRLIKAFPSYLFLIIDEHGGWIDDRKFWSNYYIYQNILDINVHSTYDNPVSVAKVSLTNIYRNIREFKSQTSLTDIVMGKDNKFDILHGNDSDYGLVNQIAYMCFGSIPFEKITDDMIDIRNKLFDEIFIREGVRIHIRLGYGSNPSNYAPVFSGSVYEVLDEGDVITIAAQSDGVELVSSVLTDRTSATNKDLGLPEECGDIIAGILCNRENEFFYSLTGGKAFIDNTYGINHFGTYSQGYKEGWQPFQWSPANYGDVGQVFEDIGIGGLIGGVVGFLASPLVGISIAAGNAMQKAVVQRRAEYEYDIVKNIYKATYDGEYIFDPQFYEMDGEMNFRFFCYDRTPWDVFKMCEKMMPKFVCYPRPFGFEHRIFFGLPWWQCKYRYERDDSSQQVYEFSKSFAQVNFATTKYDIIDNTVKATSKNLVTNMIGIYSLGGDLASTPVIMSDWYIDRSKQKTATIDTTATQNFKGLPNLLDKALSWVGVYDNGKHQAIRICASELIDAWLNTYTGYILMLGSPDVLPFNYMYISDLYAKIEGVAEVKSVTHSLNGTTGFTTTVYPGLIADTTLDNAGTSNILGTIFHVGTSVAAFCTQAYMAGKMIESMKSSITATIKSNDLYLKGKNFLKHDGKEIISNIKNGKILSKPISILNNLKKKVDDMPEAVKAIQGIKSFMNKSFKFTKGVVMIAVPYSKVIIYGAQIVASVFLSRMITNFLDFFRYRECIRVYPLLQNNVYMLAGAKSYKTLIPDVMKEIVNKEREEDAIEDNT